MMPAGPGFIPPFIPPSPGIPGPLRVISGLVRNNLSILPEAAYHEPAVVIPGLQRIVVVTGPELTGEFLQKQGDRFPKGRLQNEALMPLFGNAMISSEGADWRWQRQAAAPLFRHQDMMDYGPIMTASAEAMVRLWREAPGQPRLINRDMMRAAFAVISNTMLAGGASDVIAAIEKGHGEYFKYVNWWLANRYLGLPAWLPRPGKAAMHRHEDNLRQSVRALVREKRARGAHQDDLLGKLLAAKDPETGRGMDDERIANNIATFLVAGYDTTALSLSWALYLIAKSPDWARRIREEVNEVCGAGPVGSAHYEALTTTRMVLSEALRLFPTAPIILRDVLEDTELQEVRFKAGDIVMLPIYAMHRHRQSWENPDTFDPSRFALDSPKPVRHSYLPFGAGKRICIGAAFAMLEGVIMLATFVRAADFEPLSPEPEPMGQLFLTARAGIRMRVSPI